MYETRLEMAAGWLWNFKPRREGEPALRPFTQQPQDVTAPIEAELTEVIRAIDTYDSCRDILRVDLRRIRENAVRLYKGLHPDDWVQTITEDKLKELEGSVMMMLHHIKVEGDSPWDYPPKS